MNKIWLFGAAVCMVLALGSCLKTQNLYGYHSYGKNQRRSR